MNIAGRRSTIFGLALLLIALLPNGWEGVPETHAQTSSHGPNECPTTGPCRPSVGHSYSKVGARLRLARDLIQTAGPEAPVFGPGGAPRDLTARSGGASLRFRRVLDDRQIDRLRALGIRLARDDAGRPLRIGAIYLAEVPWSSLEPLASLPFLIRAESTWAPKLERPLEVTSREVGASSLRRIPRYDLSGEGMVLGDIDSGFDIYHPHLFRADGGWYRWIDVENDGRFDPGTDGVDLDANGSLESDEVLKVLDATVWTNKGRVNNDGELQPAKDWLFVDANGDGKRNVGPSEGFGESDPAYGEPVFVVDDLDSDGRLEPTEKLVQLNTSKFTRVVENQNEYVRGENLAELGKPQPEDRAYHGTGVASVLVGGQPRFHERVGLAPDADLVGYAHSAQSRRNQGQFALEQHYISDASSSDVDVLVHEWTDFFSTPQDGSTNIEAAMDEARSQGTIQVNPVGNLNLSKKHIERPVTSGDTPTLEFLVDEGFQRGGQTYPYRVVWGALLWRTDQNPTMTLRTPAGNTLELDPTGQSQTVGNHTVFVQSQVSPRMTHHVLFAIWDRQNGLDEGTWGVQLTDISKQDRIVGRISDRYSSWSVGVRWKNPSRDRGTMVYPSTADSAVGVAAFGGRHDMPRDGAGSKDGELRNYSGRGPRIDGARGVDIAAPDDPYAAFGVSSRYTERGVGRSWFRRFGGTSGAGPHVAAAFALLMEAHPSWEPDKLESRLFETADTDMLVPDAGSTPNLAWGHGKIDLYEAVTDMDQPPGDGEPPAARLAVRTETEQIRFDASNSTDPDSQNLEYRFDFEYDGEWDRGWASAARATAPRSAFDEPGAHLARVEVRDALGHHSGAGARFELDPVAGDAGPDGGVADVMEPGPDGTDAGEIDAGGDAPGSRDSSRSAPAPTVANQSGSTDGCSGCTSSGGPAPLAWWSVLALVALVRIRRR